MNKLLKKVGRPPYKAEVSKVCKISSCRCFEKQYLFQDGLRRSGVCGILLLADECENCLVTLDRFDCEQSLPVLVACGIWCSVDVSSVSPSSEQTEGSEQSLSLLRRRANARNVC